MLLVWCVRRLTGFLQSPRTGNPCVARVLKQFTTLGHLVLPLRLLPEVGYALQTWQRCSKQGESSRIAMNRGIRLSAHIEPGRVLARPYLQRNLHGLLTLYSNSEKVTAIIILNPCRVQSR